jgi:BirA family biotin operon repressor/biotin-[acetyl-CoA-carboxylase] ligase
MPLDWLEKYTLHSYNVLPSTNLEAKNLIKHNIVGNHIIWALSQTDGYGKISRKWESGDGDLTFSLIIEYDYPIMLIYNLLFVTAISIRKIINDIFENYNIKKEIKVKWPNDIMIDKKKICGIMVETLKSPGGNSFAVIGIGLNILYQSTNSDLPFTSLKEFNIIDIDLSTIMKNIVINFEQYKLIWSKNGLGPIRSIWTEHAYGLGSEIMVNNGKSLINGIFTGIDNAGSINLLTKSGLTVPISVGEVFFKK